MDIDALIDRCNSNVASDPRPIMARDCAFAFMWKFGNSPYRIDDVFQRLDSRIQQALVDISHMSDEDWYTTNCKIQVSSRSVIPHPLFERVEIIENDPPEILIHRRSGALRYVEKIEPDHWLRASITALRVYLKSCSNSFG